jgi:hypothetical protein
VRREVWRSADWQSGVSRIGNPQGERLKRLNQIAIRQMQILTATRHLRQTQKRLKAKR